MNKLPPAEGKRALEDGEETGASNVKRSKCERDPSKPTANLVAVDSPSPPAIHHAAGLPKSDTQDSETTSKSVKARPKVYVDNAPPTQPAAQAPAQPKAIARDSLPTSVPAALDKAKSESTALTTTTADTPLSTTATTTASATSRLTPSGTDTSTAKNALGGTSSSLGQNDANASRRLPPGLYVPPDTGNEFFARFGLMTALTVANPSPQNEHGRFCPLLTQPTLLHCCMCMTHFTASWHPHKPKTTSTAASGGSARLYCCSGCHSKKR